EKEMSRCIRCYACRNVCPTCYCMHQCIAQTRKPNWMSQNTGTVEKKFFQIIRAIHNAGRCTDCGECQRVCPMGIPINLINKKLGKEVLELFSYTTGIDVEEKPPLMTFREVEEKITD
ncbi:MAG: 4Fe-4S dicluster domain-containing protein, partial [Thermodesulfobacteriota bacterium]